MIWKRLEASGFAATLLFPALFVLITTGCTKPEINFGNNFANTNSTNVVAVDTFSVRMSTIFQDSFPTSGTGTILLGQYRDPYFGLVTSKSYFDIKPPGALPTITNLDTYDSFSLVLRINKTFYGDTTQLQTIRVNRLTQLIQLPNTQTTFFNINSFAAESTPLGTASFVENPTRGFTSQRLNDSVKVKLPDELGQEFFRLLFNQSDTLKNTSTFLNYFRGLVVSPDPASVGAIFGFQDSAFIRLYYHEPGLLFTPKFVDFPINGKGNQFNHISADRTGTPSAGIDSLHPDVSSTETGNMAFVQSATGLEVKLLFPTIGGLQQYQDYLSVLKAELVIRPVAGTYSPLYALPGGINLNITNEGNLAGALLPSGTGSLIIDYVYGASTSYSYDITAFIKQQITLGAENNAKNGLLLDVPAPQYNTLFNRAVFGDALNDNNINKVSLKIYYASFH